MGDFNWSSLSSGIGSLAGGILGLVASNKKNTNDWNINQANIELQREMNQKNEQLWREKFDYDKWQYLHTLAYNSKEAREAFDRESKWNSPVNQMAELRKAGINPFSVFGQNGSVSAVHSSPASGANSSTTPPPSMLAPSLSFQNSGLAATLQMVDAVANVIDKISSSSLRGSQKKEIDTLLVDNLKKLQVETDNEKAKASLNTLLVEFEQTFGYAMREQNLQNAVADYEKTVSEIAKNIAEGNYIDEKIVTEQTQQDLNRILKKKHGVERDLLAKQVNSFDTRLHQEIKESNSRIEENRARAAESRAYAATQNEIRPFVSRINAANARIQENEAAFKDETFLADVEKTMDSLQQMGIVTQSMQKQLDLAIKENNWYVAKQIIGLACDISNSASQWMPKVSISRESRSGSDRIRGNYYEEKETRNKSRVGR